jgi:hypothetical protein
MDGAAGSFIFRNACAMGWFPIPAAARDGEQRADWPRAKDSASGEPKPVEGGERDGKGDGPRDQHLPRLLGPILAFLSVSWKVAACCRHSGQHYSNAWKAQF